MAVRRSLAERLEAERLRKDKAEQRIKVLERDHGRIERAKTIRREGLVGQLVLRQLSNDPQGAFSEQLKDWLKEELPVVLTRDTDKALFAELMEKAPSEDEAAGVKSDGMVDTSTN